ncbi:FAD-binding oxidoreductase [Plantactinospora mayteni]|uniref:FAD-linked oxidase n=1 Tax=Plantactinospora mayteni TaxID=566021 RepID=A0ABQ4EXX4_9ACTN|nr:FAD-binding protein [Plantactinospora mayteni]GIG99462.1 FAD-linked oxidase [Plantactinospora mayteni]
MAEHRRRDLLRTTAVAAVAAGMAAHQLHRPAPAAVVSAGDCPPPFGPVAVGPDDPRYPDLVRRGNRRFVGTPDQVRVVGSTEQVRAAVQAGVQAGQRIAVRSGGHCFEDFVDSPQIRMVIDLSGMTGVYYDPLRNAFAVEAGATLGEVYRRLYLGWGVTLPGGSCPGVGAGGHVAGGGYGPLSRLHGLVVDHLYAVEVVTVDQSGTAHTVVATRERDDPNRELWWAHTGGGGGNFGVVTRYWFRSPGATGDDPSRLLPRPPGSVLTFTVQWPWQGMTERGFARLARNFGDWCVRHRAPGTPQASLYGELLLTRRPAGNHTLVGQVAGGADGARLLDEHIAVLGAGVGVAPIRTEESLPWLTSALRGNGDDGKRWRLKTKAGYLRRGLTNRQIAAAYHHLTRADYDNPVGSLSLNTYGGQINTVASAATATAQRDSVIKLFYLAGWVDPAEDARHLAWIREFYRDVYADTGGVPVSGDVNDGSYINYPDVDLADPAWNTSGVPWHSLYYGANYPRLRAAKARWDPRNVFRHGLSVQPG